MSVIGENSESRHADKPAEALFTHHQAESEQNKHNGADAEVHQIFHYDIAGVFGPCESAFDHREAALHKEYKRSPDQKPYTEYALRNGGKY